jgi:outer membrane immunogenic protein
MAAIRISDPGYLGAATNNVSFSTLGCCLMSVPARQQPFRVRRAIAPPPPAPTYWSGFYIGAFGGWGWNNQNDWRCVSVPGAEEEGCFGQLIGTNHSQSALSGGLAGGQIGYDWRWDRVVLGLQADGAWADIKGSAGNPLNPRDQRCGFALGQGSQDQTVECRTTITAMADLTARAGYLFWENTLIYGKFGINWSSIDFQVLNDVGFSGTCGPPGSQPGPHPGYNANSVGRVSPTVGIGIEQRIWNGLSVFGEYDFVANGGSYTNLNTGGTGAGGCTADFVSTTTIRDTNIVKFGLNWTFGSGLLGAPLVAKY